MKPPDPYPPGTAVFTGTFDPITLGHLDVIGRGRLLFEHLVVAIGVNLNKTSLFDVEEPRPDGADASFWHRFLNVSVRGF